MAPRVVLLAALALLAVSLAEAGPGGRPDIGGDDGVQRGPDFVSEPRGGGRPSKIDVLEHDDYRILIRPFERRGGGRRDNINKDLRADLEDRGLGNAKARTGMAAGSGFRPREALWPGQAYSGVGVGEPGVRLTPR